MSRKNNGVPLNIRLIALGLILVISLLQTSSPSAAQASSLHQHIVVQIRNGKTGRAIWIASPYVFLGSPDISKFDESYRRTKFWSDARVDVTGTEPREVRVWVDFIDRDCRYSTDVKDYRSFDYGGRTLRNMPVYDIDKVLSTGIVTPNLCGTKTQQPKPGILTIYVIPESFKELWNS